MTIAHPSIAALTLLALLYSAPSHAQDAVLRNAVTWPARFAPIPIGATVTLRTTAGERLKAVLLATDDSGIVVKPATRFPESSRRFSYDSLRDIKRYDDRVSFGKCVGTGVAIGGAVFLSLLMAAR